MDDSTGFSLLELLVALGLATIATILVVATILKVVIPSQKATDLSAGYAMAQSVMQEEIYAVLDGTGVITKAAFLNNDSPPAAPISGARIVNDTNFDYRIYHQTLQDTVAAAPLGGSLENRVKKVDIVVWWWNQNPGDVRQDYGTLKVEASQLFIYKPEF